MISTFERLGMLNYGYEYGPDLSQEQARAYEPERRRVSLRRFAALVKPS